MSLFWNLLHLFHFGFAYFQFASELSPEYDLVDQGVGGVGHVSLGTCDLWGDGGLSIIYAIINAYTPLNTTLNTTLVARRRGLDSFEPVVQIAQGIFFGLQFECYDVDKDGWNDLVFTNASQVMWRRNMGYLSFGPMAALVTVPLSINYYAWGDIDGDGLLDLVITILGYCHWAKNLGGGNFNTSQLLASIPGLVYATPALINNDGYADLLINNGASLYWMKNVGGASLIQQDVLPPFLGKDGIVPPTVYFPSVVTDLNGDGWVDIVSVVNLDEGGNTGTSAVLCVYFATSGGSTPIFNLTNLTGPEHVISLLVGDADGDGDMDIIYWTSSVLHLFENVRGVLTARDSQVDSLGGDRLTFWNYPFTTPQNRIALGDMDGDGNLDLIAVSQIGAAQFVLQIGSVKQQNPPGVWDLDVQLISSSTRFSSTTLYQVSSADINHDGYDDILVGNSTLIDSKTYSLAIEIRTQIPPPTPPSSSFFFIRDVNYNQPIIAISLPTLALPSSVSGLAYLLFDLIDLDHDGDMDLITTAIFATSTSSNKYDIYSHINNGNPVPSFTSQHLATFDASAGNSKLDYAAAAIIDITNDGYPDLVLPNLTVHTDSSLLQPQPNLVGLNLTLVGVDNSNMGLNSTGSQFADFIVITDGSVLMHLARFSNGSWSQPQSISSSWAGSGSDGVVECAVMADVDADGHLDIVAQAVDGTMEWFPKRYFSSLDIWTWDSPRTIASSPSSQSIPLRLCGKQKLIRDVDLDFYPDIITNDGNRTTFFRNTFVSLTSTDVDDGQFDQGIPGIKQSANLSPCPGVHIAVALSDIDRDMDVDLVVLAVAPNNTLQLCIARNPGLTITVDPTISGSNCVGYACPSLRTAVAFPMNHKAAPLTLRFNTTSIITAASTPAGDQTPWRIAGRRSVRAIGINGHQQQYTVLDFAGNLGVEVELRDSATLILSRLSIRNAKSSTASGSVGGGCLTQITGITSARYSEFLSCTALLANGGGGGNGGGVLIQSGQFWATSVNFQQNVANGGQGGAIYVASSTGQVVLLNSIFTENTALDAMNGEGGACTVVGGTLTAYLCSWVNNMATSGGALTVFLKGMVNVTLSTFTNNQASVDGGAFYSNDCPASATLFTECSFVNNSAVTGGGAVAIRRSSVAMAGCTLDGNFADQGGAVYLTLTAQLTSTSIADHGVVASSTMSNNLARQGGAIYSRFRSKLSLQDTIITNNSATGDGGAVYVSQSALIVVRANLNDNVASGSGGALFVDNTSFSIVNSSLLQNHAGLNGGALSISNVMDTTTPGCVWSNSDCTSSSDEYGSCLYWDTTTMTEPTNCSIFQQSSIPNWVATQPVKFQDITSLAQLQQSHNSGEMLAKFTVFVQDAYGQLNQFEDELVVNAVIIPTGNNDASIVEGGIEHAMLGGVSFNDLTVSAYPGTSVILHFCTSSINQGFCSNNATLTFRNCNQGEYIENTAFLTCSSCLAGKFSNSPNTAACMGCPSGSYSGPGATACTWCQEDEFALANSSTPSACPLGTWSAANASSCTDCPRGRASKGGGTGFSRCIPCTDGTGAPNSGAAVCIPCPSGTISPNCTACPPGQEATGDSCVSCDIYAFRDNQITCEMCPQGRQADGNRTACVTCLAGFFRVADDKHGCQNCTLGKWSNGLSDLGACLDCPLGNYTGADRASCVACPPGTTSLGANQVSCAPCSPGAYRTVAMSDCSLCPFPLAANANHTDCGPCPGNNTHGVNGICVACPANYYRLAGSHDQTTWSCQPCSGIAGNGTCDCCPANYYIFNTSSTNSLPRTCVKCDEGTMNPGNQYTCQSCGELDIVGVSTSTMCSLGPASRPTPAGTCTSCPLGKKATDDPAKNECICNVGYYRAGELCVACPSGGDCEGQSGADVPPLAGWWRLNGANNDTFSFIQCIRASHCLGAAGCSFARTGPLCGRCVAGYSESITGDCVACPPQKHTSTGESVALVIAVVIALAVLYYIVIRQKVIKPERKVAYDDAQFMVDGVPTRPVTAEARLKRTFTYNVKILVGFLQIATALTSLSDVPWPHAFSTLVSGFRFLNLDIIPWTSIQCATPINFYTKLVVICITPPIVLFLTVVCFLIPLYVINRYDMSDEAAGRIKRANLEGQFWKCLLFTFFLIYPGVSTYVLGFFKCQQVDNQYFLLDDFTVSCYDATWKKWMPFAVAMTVVYPVGIPIAAFTCLFLRDRPIFRGHLGLLHDAYRGPMWWFEVLDMTVKMVLTSCLFFLRPHHFQVGMAVVAAHCLGIMLMMPYIRKPDENLHLLGLGELYAFIFVGYLLQVQERQNPTKPLDPAVDTALSVLCIGLLIVALIMFFYNVALATKTIIVAIKRHATHKKYAKSKSMGTSLNLSNRSSGIIPGDQSGVVGTNDQSGVVGADVGSININSSASSATSATNDTRHKGAKSVGFSG